MSLIAVLQKISDITLSKGGRTVLSSLGVGLVSSSVSISLFNSYITYLQNSYSALGDVAGILGLAGVPYGLSIIISAVVIKITLKAKNVSLGKSS
ncbi:DUF2523 family protein [Acinetobacter baumannii]|uniref:DUF2523 family protein n=1 Tax=Acinetobacter baumannii TaxID=470 RepID=UPI001CA7E889|nr:DUF2523 family protein [Acinetobacter baumannii]MDX7905207.1 DUF2523 family protein [Acinetobacter baumannii]MDX7908801.1 DUF2523 family protein [Acinetobacter baumannii]MDX7928104.1 DUF2523 family protein [Acinetobacter baumannii]UAB21448.1 DUF2523 domain-containing protein [Acinetobacter baumannii]UAB21456.1 DUF2523 domain-containing protein [Acinetobacter baumannii]